MTQPISSIYAALQAAVKGLLFPSETDSPVTALYWPSSDIDGVLTTEALLAHEHYPSETPVEHVDFETFFAGYVPDPDAVKAGELDPEQLQTMARLQSLAELMRSSLSDLIVFRVGRVSIDVYVLGRDKDQNVLGVQTRVVET